MHTTAHKADSNSSEKVGKGQDQLSVSMPPPSTKSLIISRMCVMACRRQASAEQLLLMVQQTQTAPLEAHLEAALRCYVFPHLLAMLEDPAQPVSCVMHTANCLLHGTHETHVMVGILRTPASYTMLPGTALTSMKTIGILHSWKPQQLTLSRLTGLELSSLWKVLCHQLAQLGGQVDALHARLCQPLCGWRNAAAVHAANSPSDTTWPSSR